MLKENFVWREQHKSSIKSGNKVYFLFTLRNGRDTAKGARKG